MIINTAFRFPKKKIKNVKGHMLLGWVFGQICIKINAG